MKNVKSAASKLPQGIRKEFLETWKATGMMDLYEGDLKSYFSVIKSELESRQRRIEKLKDLIANATKILTQ